MLDVDVIVADNGAQFHVCCMSQVIDISVSEPSWVMHALRTASLAAVANMSDHVAHHSCRALDVLTLLKPLTMTR
jgi:hypothetical protein